MAGGPGSLGPLLPAVSGSRFAGPPVPDSPWILSAAEGPFVSPYLAALRAYVGHAPLIMAAAGVVLMASDGRILLQLRTDNDCWGIPGGSMEPGEAFEDVARRELFEETGLTAGHLDLLCLNSGPEAAYTYPNGDAVHLAGVVFTSTDFSGVLAPQPSETAALEWFDPLRLPANLNPLDRGPLETLAARVRRDSR